MHNQQSGNDDDTNIPTISGNDNEQRMLNHVDLYSDEDNSNQFITVDDEEVQAEHSQNQENSMEIDHKYR